MLSWLRRRELPPVRQQIQHILGDLSREIE
jgi:hypothetical protein